MGRQEERGESRMNARGSSRLGNALTISGLLLTLAGCLLVASQLPSVIDTYLPSSPPRVTASPLPLLTASPLPPVPVSPSPRLSVSPPPSPTASPTPCATPTPLPAPVVYSPTRILIPSIGLDAPVVTTTWETINVNGVTSAVWIVPAERAAGWHAGSAPLGQPGNTVLNGHNWPEDAVFRYLHQAQVGDSIIIYAGAIPFHYRIAEMLILPEGGETLEVRAENARFIQPTADERVTLVTCYPYGSLRNRLIVIARPERSGIAAEHVGD